MYKIIGGVLLILALVGISNKVSYELGASRETERSVGLANKVAKKVKVETLALQKSNDELARLYYESSIKSFQKEKQSNSELDRLHLEASRNPHKCDDNNVPYDNFPARVLVISQAIASSGLPDSYDKPCFVTTPHEVEKCYIQEVYDHEKTKQQLDKLIKSK